MKTLLLLALAMATVSSQPATAPTDKALWARLSEIDARAAKVQGLSANFEQQRFTALLTRPLVSSGKIRIHGPQMRWDTEKPERSVMLIDQREAKIYYPIQKSLEIYALDQRLGELAASPLPRLDTLKRKFSFEQIPESQMGARSDHQFLALRLVPTDASLREHVHDVRVLLDVRAACVVRAEMIDSDDEKTVLSFSNIQVNVDVGDLSLNVPPGTRISHPLEALERGRSK